MYAFFEYITHITYYLVFMALVAVLAPSSGYKKYINLVMGIILVGIVIAPIAGTSGGIPVTELFDGVMAESDFDENRLTLLYNEQLTALFHVQLHEQTERLLSQNGFRLLESEWQSDLTEITSVRLTVSADETAVSRPFIYVSPVRVSPINSRLGVSPEPAEITRIKNLVADFYNIPSAHIHVTVE